MRPCHSFLRREGVLGVGRPVSPMYIFLYFKLFNSLRWPIYIFNLVDITKLSCYPHRRSTTVSLETFTFIKLVTLLAMLVIR